MSPVKTSPRERGVNPAPLSTQGGAGGEGGNFRHLPKRNSLTDIRYFRRFPANSAEFLVAVRKPV
jgi:hypothetical protein